MLPHFLCIGTQKAGTTWLYHNLDRHPQVWMPPVKEVFYFCGFALGPNGMPGAPSKLPLALQVLQPRNAALRQLAREAVRKGWRRVRGGVAPSPPEARSAAAVPSPPAEAAPSQHQAPGASGFARATWMLRYALLPRTDGWYASLFQPGPGQISGDITPYYANLGEDRVARIHGMLPHAKILYLLRDPVERLWSEAGMQSRRGGIALTDRDPRALEVWFRGHAQKQLNDYVGNLRTWQRFYRDAQVLVGFFDELNEDPVGLLRRVCGFLEIDDSPERMPADVGAKRNAGQDHGIPARWVEFLRGLFADQLRDLHARFENRYTARWLRQ
ncbi:MAG: sulfotransferase [Planctomycetota bacterium]